MRIVIEPRGAEEIAGALVAVGALLALLVAITIVFLVVRVGAEVISPGTTPPDLAPAASVTDYSPPTPPPPTTPPTCYPFQPC